jgi:hypothetical protein
VHYEGPLLVPAPYPNTIEELGVTRAADMLECKKTACSLQVYLTTIVASVSATRTHAHAHCSHDGGSGRTCKLLHNSSVSAKARVSWGSAGFASHAPFEGPVLMNELLRVRGSEMLQRFTSHQLSSCCYTWSQAYPCRLARPACRCNWSIRQKYLLPDSGAERLTAKSLQN